MIRVTIEVVPSVTGRTKTLPVIEIANVSHITGDDTYAVWHGGRTAVVHHAPMAPIEALVAKALTALDRS